MAIAGNGKTWCRDHPYDPQSMPCNIVWIVCQLASGQRDVHVLSLQLCFTGHSSWPLFAYFSRNQPVTEDRYILQIAPQDALERPQRGAGRGASTGASMDASAATCALLLGTPSGHAMSKATANDVTVETCCH